MNTNSQKLSKYQYACIVENKEKRYCIEKRSIRSLYRLYTQKRTALKGANITIQNLGKASAALLAMAKVEKVHAQTISTDAIRILQKENINVSYEQQVPYIINETHDDWCPMEKLCYYENNLNKILEKIKTFLTNRKIKTAGLIFLSVFLSKAYASEEETTFPTDSNIHTIDEVTVTGSRNQVEVRQLPLTISIVDEEQIANRYQSSVLPILNEQVPGLFITSTSVLGYGVGTNASGMMSMRGIGGSPTTRLLMLVDGQPQYMGLMGHPLADVYQSMSAERVEVVRGPASVLYGSNAMGGVINIVTPQLKQDSSITQAQMSYGAFNTLETSASNRYQKGKFSSKIAASYNRTNGHRDNMEFNQVNAYAKLNYELNQQWQLSANLNYTDYNVSNPGSEEAPVIDNDSHIKRGMSSLTINNKYSKTSGATMLFYNWGDHFINDGYAEGSTPLTYRFNSTDQTAGLIAYQSIQAFENNTITVGADIFQIGGEAWNTFTNSDATFSFADTTANEIAGYVDVRQNFGSVLTLDAGIRYDYHTQSGGEWIPQAGLSAHLAHNIELKAMVSKGFRNPTLKELYMFMSKNPELKPESLVNYELSFNQKLYKNAMAYGVNLFYLEGDNLIQTVFSNGSPQNINTGAVENYGLEATFSYHINPYWSTSANYSYLYMENPVVAAPEHKVYAGLTYHKNKVSINSGLQYVDGLYTSTSPEEKENFVLWNARASYQLSPSLQLFARGENLLNQDYEINKGYSMPGATISGGFKLKF